MKYRLQQARESVEEAEFLFQGGKSPRAVINRAYYAMYYAVLSLLVFEPFISSKHTGVISYFNQRFINQQVFPKEMGKWFNRAFEMRQISDYREYMDLNRGQVEPFIAHARQFIEAIADHLKKTEQTIQ